MEETQPRAAEISGNTTEQLRAGAVRLYQTVHAIAHDRLIEGDKDGARVALVVDFLWDRAHPCVCVFPYVLPCSSTRNSL